MARVRLCVCGSWFVGREGQAAHPRAPGQCLHFECRGAPARIRVWRCEGRPPLPHHFVCVEKFTLPYLTLVTNLRIYTDLRIDTPPSPSRGPAVRRRSTNQVGAGLHRRETDN